MWDYTEVAGRSTSAAPELRGGHRLVEGRGHVSLGVPASASAEPLLGAQRALSKALLSWSRGRRLQGSIPGAEAVLGTAQARQPLTGQQR